MGIGTWLVHAIIYFIAIYLLSGTRLVQREDARVNRIRYTLFWAVTLPTISAISSYVELRYNLEFWPVLGIFIALFIVTVRYLYRPLTQWITNQPADKKH